MITVDRVRGLYSDPGGALRVGHRNGLLFLQRDAKSMEITTTEAANTCLALGRMVSKLEPGEFIVLTINGEAIHLLPEVALKLSGALLRKADAADDWQLAFRNPRRH